jgi:hypothetical protein
MRDTILTAFVVVLGVAFCVADGSATWASDSHHLHPRHLFNGSCGVYHFQIVEIDHYRIRKAALTPAHYCGLWWNGNPTDTGPSVSGNINNGQLSVR